MQREFDIVLQDIRTKLHQRLAALPHKVGAVVIAHTNDAFRDGGFTDEAFEPWEPRKANKKKNEGRAILVQSGRLRRSIRIISATADSVIVGTDVPYAQVHNEGGNISHLASNAILNYTKDKKGKLHLARVRTITQQRKIDTIRRASIASHTSKMPQRKFLGNSHTQTKEIELLIHYEISKALSRK
jgi:phage gpG-like protein